MFEGNGLFKGIQCPKGQRCDLINCIFGHEQHQTIKQQAKASKDVSQSSWTQYSEGPNALEGGDRKRIKLDNGHKAAVKVSPENGKSSMSSTGSSFLKVNHQETATKKHNAIVKENRLETLSKPVSPPSTVKQKNMATYNVPVEEKLVPRSLSRNPVQWNLRLQYLKALHAELSRLNKLVIEKNEEKNKIIQLTQQAVIKFALDEEEKLAKTKPTLYKGAIGHLILRYKKMNLQEWVDEQMRQHAKQIPKSCNGAFVQDPDLKPLHENIMLRCYRADLKVMKKYDYITEVPPETAIEDTRKAIETAGNWEVCDRCGTRFQVFPTRRLEDGALTTRGKCTYHPNRAFKSNHPCCGSAKGTEGCTTNATHVFKSTDPKRLAEVLQFESTKPGEAGYFINAIVFDCEMGYTTRGMEVIRLSACTFPDLEPMIDVLVQPYGEILDLNTQFSGVTAEQFANAPAYDGSPRPHGSVVMKAASPAQAREILLKDVAAQTVLIGHAIDNDLRVLRIIHPTIVDTAILYPHKTGFPRRNGLRALASQFLNKDIQTSEVAGHDSMEDAKTTGELVRAKIRFDWNNMRNKGWKAPPSASYGFMKPNAITDAQALKLLNQYCLAPKMSWWLKWGDEYKEEVSMMK